MKNPNDPPQTPVPAFDEKSAVAVPPTRHEPTGRTFCFVQADALFSATRLFIATQQSRPEPVERASAASVTP